MPNNSIIKSEREGVPQIIDAALLAQAAAGQEVETRKTVHHNTLDVIPGLHRKMQQLLDQLSDSFATQMKSAGIGIGLMHVSWWPAGNEQDAYENLSRSQLVLELQRLPIRQSEVNIPRKIIRPSGRMIQ